MLPILIQYAKANFSYYMIPYNWWGLWVLRPCMRDVNSVVFWYCCTSRTTVISNSNALLRYMLCLLEEVFDTSWPLRTSTRPFPYCTGELFNPLRHPNGLSRRQASKRSLKSVWKASTIWSVSEYPLRTKQKVPLETHFNILRQAPVAQDRP